MKTRRVELTAGGKSLAEAKIQRGIFLGDALSPLQFVKAMMSFNNKFRKCTDGYKLNELQEKINPLMYVNNIKLFAKTKKLKTLIHAVRICSEDIGKKLADTNLSC